MPAQWLENTGQLAQRVASGVQRGLSRPETPRRLRAILVLLLLGWALFAMAQLIWALWPSPAAQPLPGDLINPASRSESTGPVRQIDIEALAARALFGEALANVAAETLPLQPDSGSAGRDRQGIEEGARETRLDLSLRGVVASTEEGFGHAIIEHRKRQAVYAVDDELPGGRRVRLAKVMHDQVVLENNGTYELLTLFDESELGAQLQGHTSAMQPAAPGPALEVDKRSDAEAAALASRYRQQLYDNPQSLASLVRINAVRDGDALRGYRVVPGKDARQFQQLGFRAGDLVVAVNGVSLDDPANTMRIYQAMRSATEASFELIRGDQAVTLTVDLGAAGDVQ